MKANPTQRNLIQAFLISLLFSVLGMVLVFWYGDLTLAELARLQDINELALLAAVIALLASLVIAAFRLQLLCTRLGLRLGFWHGVRTHVLGMFGAAVTPSGGGSAPLIALNLSYHGLSPAQAWATVITLFVADALFLIWSLPLSIIYLRSQGLYPKDPLWTVLGVLAPLITALIAVLLTYRLNWLEHLIRVLCRGPLSRLRDSLLNFSKSLLSSSQLFGDAGPSYHLRLQLWTTLSWLSYFLVLVFAIRGFDLPVGWLEAEAWQLVITALSFVIPTPGGSGFFEFGTSLLLLNKGNDSVVPAILLVYRLLTYYLFFLLGLPLGGYVLLKHLERTQAAKQTKPD